MIPWNKKTSTLLKAHLSNAVFDSANSFGLNHKRVLRYINLYFLNIKR